MKIYQYNIFERWPLKDKSVQAIITSPPFWSLRKYDIPDVIIGGDKDCEHKFRNTEAIHDNLRFRGGGVSTKVGANKNPLIYDRKKQIQKVCKCGAWKGQHGLEPTFQLYIKHICLWAKEAWRVLRDDGIFFLNLGDSYNNSSAQIGRQDKSKYGGKTGIHCLRGGVPFLPSKCKILIPHRVAIALIDDGWILRNDIVWYKPNAMPESVTDRFSKKFEYIFMFVKQPKYYFNLDAIRERHTTEEYRSRDILSKKWSNWRQKVKDGEYGEQKRLTKHELATQRQGSYQDPLHIKPYHPKGKNPGDLWNILTQPSPFRHYAMWPEALVERMILCSTKSGDIVLDPFVGSGTTVRVAERLNRIGVGFDLGYEDIQKERLKEIQKELSYEK